MAKADFDFKADNWWELVNLNALGVEECPIMLTTDIPMKSLELSLTTVEPFKNLLNFSSDSQSVDHAVKLITEASAHAVGLQRRHKYAETVVMSRKCRAKFETKSHYSETYMTLL